MSFPRLLVVIGIVALAWWKWGAPGESRPATRNYPEPSPMPAESELQADAPATFDFDAAGWQEETRANARQFSFVGDQTYHCNMAWRNDVDRMGAGFRVQFSELRGRRGICVWRAMRIVDRLGVERSRYIRPGPRRWGDGAGVSCDRKRDGRRVCEPGCDWK